MDQIIEGYVVDILKQSIYYARIYFDSHIKKIEPCEPGSSSVFMMPGLVDAHVHIESSMLPPSEFARLALSKGTLCAVADPHEIANVLGVDGIRFMEMDAQKVSFHFVFGAPSCVPATTFDLSGAKISSEDIEDLFAENRVQFLSEMMNYPGVIHHDPEVIAKIDVARKYHKPVDGHAPGLSGADLEQYIKSGISTDHEASTLKEAEEKIEKGMKILIREGSAAKNFEALSPLIDQYPDKVMLCTDDLHPDDLINGHINNLLSRGVAKGFNLFSLLKAAILNPVQHYDIDMGLLQIGDPADFIVVDDLQNFNISQSYIAGECLYNRSGEESCKRDNLVDHYPNSFGASKIQVEDLEVIASTEKMKVIQVVDGELITNKILYPVSIGQSISSDIGNDILKIVLLNRYKEVKPIVGFIKGFGLSDGALVSSVAHDSHHIIAVGCSDSLIVEAVNKIVDFKGGLVALDNKSAISLHLDIAGLMSSDCGEEVARKYELLNMKAAEMGSRLKAPFMTLSFMALLVIPELKIGENGLFDVKQFCWTNLFE